MATLSRSISVFSDGDIQVRVPQDELPPLGLPADKKFVRVLHELELPKDRRITPLGRPEVRPFFPNHFSPFDKSWQLFSKAMNPLLSAGNWTAVYHHKLWITNNNGYGMNDDPRANFVEMVNMDKPLSKVEALTCGGNLLHVIGETSGSYVIETLDWRNPPQTLEWIDAHPWLVTRAVNMDSNGTPRRFTQGKQPNGYVPGVRHPLLANPGRYTITIPKWRVVNWTQGTPPDPYKIYMQV